MFYRKINRNSKRPISGIDGKKKSEFKNQLGIFSTVARKYWNRWIDAYLMALDAKASDLLF